MRTFRPWLAIGLCAALAVLVVYLLPRALAPLFGVTSRYSGEPVLEIETQGSQDWLVYCLGRNWRGGLSLWRSPSPETGQERLYNPVRDLVIDVIEGPDGRRIVVYSNSGEALSKQETDAVQFCASSRDLRQR